MRIATPRLTSAVVLWASFLSVLAAAPGARAALTWEFTNSGDPQGWGYGCYHDVTWPFTVSGGVLHTTVTGADPYLCTLTLSEPVASLPAAHLRMRVGPGGGMLAALYWSIYEQPGFSEDHKLEFAVAPDGRWHDYFLSLWQQAGWYGTLGRLRLDPPERGWPAAVDIDFIRLGAGPELALEPAQQVAVAGEPAILRCRVMNTGPPAVDNISVCLSTPGSLAVAEPATRLIGSLAAGAETTVTWQVTATTEGDYACQATLAWPGGLATSAATFTAEAALPALSAERPTGAQAYLADGHAVLENENLRLVFPRTGGLYDACLVFAWTDTGWRRVGAMAPLCHLAYAGLDNATHVIDMGAADCTADNSATPTLTFRRVVADVDGVTWTLTASYAVASGDQSVAMRHTAAPTLGRHLKHFSGPVLYAGDGGFGSSKETAVLPGLEWLEGDE
jgi:hypothetical protein